MEIHTRQKNRSKACFDMQPTNLHVDITPTGHYEVWIRTVDLVCLKDDNAQNRSPMISATHKTSLPKLYEARGACIYKPDGNCIGMMTPEHFTLLRERFYEAQKNGLHRDMSTVQCPASEIAGLLQDHQARLKTPEASQKRLESYSRTLPQHITRAQKKKRRLLWTLILGTPHMEGTSLWHCLWCQLQCICHQVYRFLNLSPSV